jgi:hypothetical protein
MYGQNPLMFDMAVDEIADVALEQADAVIETARETQEENNQKIREIVAKHNDEEVRYLPFLPKSTASSSNFNPNPPQPTEEKPRSRSPKTKPLHGGFTSKGKAFVAGVVEKTEAKTTVVAKPRSRSRSPNPVGSGDLGGTSDKPQKKVREDTGGENTKRRGRTNSVSRPPQERATSQTRISSKEPSEAPAKAKAKAFDPKACMSELNTALKAVAEKASSSSTPSNVKAEVKPEVKTEVKTEVKKPTARAKSLEPKPKDKANTKAGAQSDDEPEMTGIKLPANDSIEFWEQQSPKELRNQLKLRYPDRFYKEWAFKDK